MRGKWILATAVALVFAVGARADNVTTQVTLEAPFGGASNVSALVNKAAGLGAGLSYTTSTGVLGSRVSAVAATELGTFKLFNGTQGTFQSFAVVEVAALQGVVAPPVGGAAFTADFTSGDAAIFAVPLGTFNPTDTATWGIGTPFFYTAHLQFPNEATVQGPMGDQDFLGQPLTGQNQASFFPATGVSSVNALAFLTTSNPGTMFAPPQPFDGFQIESTEVNSLTGSYNQATHPTNAQLDAAFLAITTLGGQGQVQGDFTANSYAQTANVNGPNTLQEVGFTQYPFQTAPIPEPASIVLMSLGALGLGVYARRQRKRVPV